MANTKQFPLQPIKDKLIVEQLKDEDKTSAGFVLQENSTDVPNRGIVVAAGPGLKDNPMEVKVGETILFSQGVGEKLAWDDKTYLVIHEENVLAIK